MRVKSKGSLARHLFLALLGAGLIATALSLPLLDVFKTSRAGGIYKGPIDVGNAFAFIFGGTAHASMEIGVGQATAELFLDNVRVGPTIMGLLGYSFLISGAAVYLVSFFLGVFKNRLLSVLTAIFAAGLLIAGGVLLILTGPEAAASYLGLSGQGLTDLLNQTGFVLGDGLLWPGVASFAAAPFVILSGISSGK